MKDDFRKFMNGTLIVFVVGLFVWIGFVYVSSCGFSVNCIRGELAIERTPVPTLIPAFLPVAEPVGAQAAADQCRAPAVDLIGAWVEAGTPPQDDFQFIDVDGRPCESTFAEVQPLFSEANLWYAGSLSCVSCHSVDLAVSPAQLDLSSYEGITAGSGRSDAASKGTDILGGSDWEKSKLREFLIEQKPDVPGHDQQNSGLLIFAGKPLSQAAPVPTIAPTVTATPTP
jgi:hypothetical protein